MKLFKRYWQFRLLLRLAYAGVALELVSRYWRGFGLVPGAELEGSDTIAGLVYFAALAGSYFPAMKLLDAAAAAIERKWRELIERLEAKAESRRP